MAIIDRIGYYTVFEDGYIVKGKEWYPLVTKSDCSVNMIPEPVQPDPTYVVTERNIWGQVIDEYPACYDAEAIQEYRLKCSVIRELNKKRQEARQKALKEFKKYRQNRLKEVQKAYLLQEKKKCMAEKAYRNRVSKRYKEYKAYMATQSKTFNVFGMKITYTPKKVAPKAKVIQKRVIKAFGRSIEIER